MSALLKRMGEALKSPWGAKGAVVVLVTEKPSPLRSWPSVKPSFCTPT